MQAIATSSGFDPVEKRVAAFRPLVPGLRHGPAPDAGAIAVPPILGRALPLPQDVAFPPCAGLFLCGLGILTQGSGILPAAVGLAGIFNGAPHGSDKTVVPAAPVAEVI